MVPSLNSTPEIDSERSTEAELRSAGQVRTSAPTRYGILSRLRSYLVIDPLIWIYTVVLGVISVPFGLFDRRSEERRVGKEVRSLWVIDCSYEDTVEKYR